MIRKKTLKNSTEIFEQFLLTINNWRRNELNITQSVEDYWKQNLYYPIIDSIIVNLEYRFSEGSLSMAPLITL
jgi:hypothetical protein